MNRDKLVKIGASIVLFTSVIIIILAIYFSPQYVANSFSSDGILNPRTVTQIESLRIETGVLGVLGALLGLLMLIWPRVTARLKSIICQEDLYLKELVRYIHLNPLRARLISDLNRLNTYKYCGHPALAGAGKKKCEWMATKYVLSFFDKKEGRARRSYNSYVKEGVCLGRRPELVGGGLIRSLGGWEAVKKAGR